MTTQLISRAENCLEAHMFLLTIFCFGSTSLLIGCSLWHKPGFCNAIKSGICVYRKGKEDQNKVSAEYMLVLRTTARKFAGG